jgi:multidrug efflux pump
VTESGTDVAFAEMQRRQRVVEDAIRSDPDVTGVVSVIGVSPINATPNAGRLAITLRQRDDRKAPVDEIVARLKRAVAEIPGMTVYFQATQDIQISTRGSRAHINIRSCPPTVTKWLSGLTSSFAACVASDVQEVASEAQGWSPRKDVDRGGAARCSSRA